MMQPSGARGKAVLMWGLEAPKCTNWALSPIELSQSTPTNLARRTVKFEDIAASTEAFQEAELS